MESSAPNSTGMFSIESLLKSSSSSSSGANISPPAPLATNSLDLHGEYKPQIFFSKAKKG